MKLCYNMLHTKYKMISHMTKLLFTSFNLRTKAALSGGAAAGTSHTAMTGVNGWVGWVLSFSILCADTLPH